MVIAVCKYIDLLETETFIRAHVNHLQADTTLIAGRPPRIGETAPSLRERATRFLYRKVGMLLPTGYQSEFTLEYKRLLNTVRPDVVLAEYGLTGVALCEACRDLSLPYVVHFHGFDAFGCEILEKYREAYATVLSRAEAVVGVSTPMCNQLLDLGAPRNCTFLNPCGVNVQLFQPGPINPEISKFLSVGRFTEKKAPHLTLLAFSKVYALHPEVRLRMIGDGRLLDSSKDLATALHIDGAVEFLGKQPHEVVRKEMQQADVFVQHSITAQSGDSEGSPVSIMEAGASSLPTISTRHAGIPDIIIHGKTGFLVDEHDVDGMADRMLKIVREQGTANHMGQMARRHIANYFSQDVSLDRLSNIMAWAAGIESQRPELTPDWSEVNEY